MIFGDVCVITGCTTALYHYHSLRLRVFMLSVTTMHHVCSRLHAHWNCARASSRTCAYTCKVIENAPTPACVLLTKTRFAYTNVYTQSVEEGYDIGKELGWGQFMRAFTCACTHALTHAHIQAHTLAIARVHTYTRTHSMLLQMMPVEESFEIGEELSKGQLSHMRVYAKQ